VLKATLSFLSTRSDRPAADSSRHSVSRVLVTSVSGGAAATVSFGVSDLNSISHSFTVSSDLSASAGAQGSRPASIFGLFLAVLAAILFLFLLLFACYIICFVWKRRRTTDESQIDYPIEAQFNGDNLLIDYYGSDNEMFVFYENPESSSVDPFIDFVDEASEATMTPE
jgi:hypothetical protein